jgi:hypothetical protein
MSDSKWMYKTTPMGPLVEISGGAFDGQRLPVRCPCGRPPDREMALVREPRGRVVAMHWACVQVDQAA